MPPGGDRAKRVITYHNPVEGMTRGTRQGLIVCGVLLATLLVFSLVSVGATHWLARTLDLIFGLCLAVAVTFVVGGTFSIQGTIYDFGVKAGGGAALLFAIIFWLQPYSATQAPPKWPVSVTLAPYTSLGEIIDHVNDERARGAHTLRFEFSEEERLVRQFRPIAPTATRTYNAKKWDEVFKEIERDSSCFRTAMKGSDVMVLSVDVAKTVEERVAKPDGSTALLRLCR